MKQSARVVRNWFLTGEALQLAVILTAIVISYTRSQSSIEESRMKIEQQWMLITQLHESLDQLRMSRSATPEAAARIGMLEVQMKQNDDRFSRIENKLDLLLEQHSK